MSFPAYPSYKDSGVEWLGEVPDHWSLPKIKHVATFAGGSTPSRDNPSFWNGNIPWVSPKDMKSETISGSEERITEDGLSQMAGGLIEPGAVLLVVRSGILRHTVPVAITSAPVALNQDMKALRFNLGQCEARFFFRWVQGLNDSLILAWMKQGATVESLEQQFLAETILPLPPKGEQVAIAAFLDREIAKIDALIEEQRRLIALLKEKRQAVISHAVTKGLDPHLPMRDSGIEWLGEVPAHWTVAPLKRVATVLAGYAFSANAFSRNNENWRLLRGVNLSVSGIRWNDDTVYWERSEDDGLSAWELRVGDVVLGMDRPWIGDGLRVAEITDDDLPCMLLQRVAAVRADCPSAQRFILHCLRHEAFFHHCAPEMTGVSVPHISGGQIEEFRMPVPPADEMSAISAHIESRSSEFAELISAAQSAIKLLSERRSALISAAVTGKIDVRGSATVLPFPVNRALARGLVATEIIERSAGQPTFGRVKFQKIAFLAEGHVGISELAGSYTREAAGPLDRSLIDEMESGASSFAGIVVDQQGGTGTTVSYRLGDQRGTHRQELADWLGADRTAKLDKLIADFAPLTTKQAEAVATLYGVWNDALSEGDSPTDDEIIAGFLNDWHPEKREKFRASELPEWLGWMRRHGIVPTGSGPNTTTGRLFV